jgi:hypothetical protein
MLLSVTLKSFLLVIMMLSFSGCKIESKILGGLDFPTNGGGTNNSNRNSNSTPRIPAVAAPLRFNSMVASYIRVAGIDNPTAINNIYTIYNAQKNNLPQMGQAAEMNPSSLSAVYMIAANVCGALRDKENPLTDTNRKIFKGFNLQAPATALTREALATDAAVKQATSALISMFFGRAATPQEMDQMVLTFAAVFAAETITATNNRKLIGDAAVVICTAVASSLEALAI